jgi:DNA-directed RNA polymerase specialized sigma24 family protein
MNDVIAGEAQTSPAAERLATLYSLYGRRVAAYIAAVMSRTYRRTDPDLVQDLAQDTWELACRYLAGCRASDDRAFGWLASVARTAVRNHFRRARTQREAAADFCTELGAMRLPASWPAEDEAIAVMRLVRMLQEPVGTPLGVAA